MEAPLTVKREADQQWPADLEQQVAACLEAFEGFVQAMHERLAAAGPLDARVRRRTEGACWVLGPPVLLLLSMYRPAFYPTSSSSGILI